jgi:hypothetical protein
MTHPVRLASAPLAQHRTGEKRPQTKLDEAELVEFLGLLSLLRGRAVVPSQKHQH